MTTDKKTATFVSESTSQSGALQRLFKLMPPSDGLNFIVVSAVSVMGTPETYVFAADESGITNYSELEGSFKGGLDHDQAVLGFGYEPVYPEGVKTADSATAGEALPGYKEKLDRWSR